MIPLRLTGFHSYKAVGGAQIPGVLLHNLCAVCVSVYHVCVIMCVCVCVCECVWCIVCTMCMCLPPTLHLTPEPSE